MSGVGLLVGLSRRDAAPGLSATAEHVLQERGFDLVAALFGNRNEHLRQGLSADAVRGLVRTRKASEAAELSAYEAARKPERE